MAEQVMNCNELKLGGYLVSKLITLGKAGNGKEFATARLTLEVGENQRIEVETFSMRNTSSGAESKIYQNLMTIHQEYKSLDSQFVDRRGKKDAQPVKHEATTVASKEECDFVYANKGIKLTNNGYIIDDNKYDLAIAVGGDGSFLRMVKQNNFNSDICYIGINNVQLL